MESECANHVHKAPREKQPCSTISIKKSITQLCIKINRRINVAQKWLEDSYTHPKTTHTKKNASSILNLNNHPFTTSKVLSFHYHQMTLNKTAPNCASLSSSSHFSTSPRIKKIHNTNSCESVSSDCQQ